MRLDEHDSERIKITVENGQENFTKADLQKIMAESETAEKKAINLGEQFKNFTCMWNLLKDYWNGEYKNIPWKLIAAIGFAVAYLISPIDIIPDFIPFAGFVDDASVFALTMSAFQSEIDAYSKWKADRQKITK